ncbi:MAG: hypothetical protein ACRDFW_01395 [bacterium]
MVTVAAAHPAGEGSPVDVFIHGEWGNPRALQFTSGTGMRQINILATTSEGYVDSRQIPIQVVECEHWFPVVFVRPNPYREHHVDFAIVNAPTTKSQVAYDWEFGDGDRLTTTVPFTSHDYGNHIVIDRPYTVFQAKVGIANVKSSARKTVTIWNNYHFQKKRGYIQPQVRTGIRLRRSGKLLIGDYSIRNREPDPLYIQSTTLEYQPCHPDKESQYQAASPSIFNPAPGQPVVVAPNQFLRDQVTLNPEKMPGEACGVLIHFQGRTGKWPTYGSLYFEIKANPIMRQRIKDRTILTFLNQIARLKLVPKTTISMEDLYRLEKEGRIERYFNSWQIVPGGRNR